MHYPRFVLLALIYPFIIFVVSVIALAIIEATVVHWEHLHHLLPR